VTGPTEGFPRSISTLDDGTFSFSVKAPSKDTDVYTLHFPEKVDVNGDGRPDYILDSPATLDARVEGHTGVLQLPATDYRYETSLTAQIDTVVQHATSALESKANELTDVARGIKSDLADMSRYSVLTEQIGRSARGGPDAPIALKAQEALSTALGWKPRDDDPKGFLGALSQSFELKDVDGHVEWKWTPRTYAVQTDLAGGISGAQASLYARAQSAADQALPLLDGLYALRSDADPEDTSALKAVIKSTFSGIVTALGQPGGPLVVKIDQAFELLLGTAPIVQTNPNYPDTIGGQLGHLRKELGLRSIGTDVDAQGQILERGQLVNTIEEEQNLTNFRILVDHVISLLLSWNSNRTFFLRGSATTTQFFGTQLVAVQRMLSVIAESTEELRKLLDSVFIGPAQQQTVEIPTGGGNSVFLDELLVWINDFATKDGPATIRDAGKFGVDNTFKPIAQQLDALVQRVIDFAAHAGGGLQTPRINRALHELKSGLAELVRLTQHIKHDIPAQA